jgi:hypothetical protein
MAQRVSNLDLERVMKFFIALAALALPIVGIADTVVPVEKVETHVNIRQAPDSSADTVGRLKQGSSLPFIASAEGWNEVRLVNGDSGFISADWTVVVVEDAVEPEPEAPSEVTAVIPIAAAEGSAGPAGPAGPQDL